MRSLELSASGEIHDKRIQEKMLSVARNQKSRPFPIWMNIWKGRLSLALPLNLRSRFITGVE